MKDIDDLLDYLKKKREYEKLLKDYGLNYSLAKNIYDLKLKHGWNIDIIARKLKIHKSTVKRYVKRMKKFEKEVKI